jgi:hypothetical protein
MFARGPSGACAKVQSDGTIDLPTDARLGPAMIERNCPGQPGVPASLSHCMDFVESQLSCTYRRPDVPDYECAFIDGDCRNTSAR